MGDIVEISLSTTIQRSEDLLTSNLGQEVVMLSVERGEYYGLNPMGSVIWQELNEPLVVAELIARLLARYEVPSEQAEAEVLAYLNKLHIFGIIQEVTPEDVGAK